VGGTVVGVVVMILAQIVNAKDKEGNTKKGGRTGGIAIVGQMETKGRGGGKFRRCSKKNRTARFGRNIK